MSLHTLHNKPGCKQMNINHKSVNNFRTCDVILTHLGIYAPTCPKKYIEENGAQF